MDIGPSGKRTNVADTERGYRTQSDETFARSMAELKRALAQREPVVPPDFEFVAETPAPREEAHSPTWAGPILLFVAIATVAAAGFHAYGRLPLSSHRVEVPAPAVTVAPAMDSPPPPSSEAVLDTLPASTVEGTLPPPASPPAPVKDERPLAGGDIAELQARLKSLGFSPGAVDGIGGPMTVTALKRYQQARGLLQTGDMTAGTLSALRREAAR
ncbi:MAG: peptidoglycan-binding protein [Proteobacteria bacterium]|nr:peptidoglycan-binding protein [Pseudomonadota bacterium]